jgi:hypothetical protein
MTVKAPRGMSPFDQITRVQVEPDFFERDKLEMLVRRRFAVEAAFCSGNVIIEEGTIAAGIIHCAAPSGRL